MNIYNTEYNALYLFMYLSVYISLSLLHIEKIESVTF